ncbi:hypothetical protein D3C81_2261680 [compost metagenome]
MIAVFTAIFYNAAPWLPLLQRVPHISKCRLGHVRVTNLIMRLAEQLAQLIAANLDKRVIRMSDVAL